MAFGLSAAAIAGIATAGAAVVGSVVSANGQRDAARDASNAQRDASAAQIALQEKQMARAEEMARPYQQAGAAADQRLRQLWNYNPADPRAAAYGSHQPGGPFGGRPGMGAASSIYQGGAPRAPTVQAGARDVTQVGYRPRPALPAPPPPPPAYQSPVPVGWTPSVPIGPYQPPAPPPPPAPTPPGGGGVDYGGRPPGSIGFEPLMGTDDWYTRFTNQQVR